MSNPPLPHHKASLTRAIERRFGKSATGYSFSASSERVVKITDTETGSWVKGEFWQGFRMKVVGEFDGSALPEADKPAAGGAHGFTRGQHVRVRDGYEFSGCTRLGEVVTQMHGAQPAWSVRCEFGGAVHYLRPDGIEVVPAMVEQPCQQPQAQAQAHALSRRTALGALALPLVPRTAAASASLRGDDTARLPDHVALWSRMPLPFTPAEAWHLLSPSTQAEIGAAVIGMHLAQYVHGDGMAEADQFLDDDLRDAACDVEHDILNRIDDRLWALFPDLYGPDRDHPAWALAAGMVHPLGVVLPEPPAAPVPAASRDPIYAAIDTADAARQAHQAIFESLDETDDAQMAHLNALVDADRAAFEALAQIVPVTRRGDIALADFYLRVLDDPDGQATDHLTHLRNVLAGDEA